MRAIAADTERRGIFHRSRPSASPIFYATTTTAAPAEGPPPRRMAEEQASRPIEAAAAFSDRASQREISAAAGTCDADMPRNAVRARDARDRML